MILMFLICLIDVNLNVGYTSFVLYDFSFIFVQINIVSLYLIEL